MVYLSGFDFFCQYQFPKNQVEPVYPRFFVTIHEQFWNHGYHEWFHVVILSRKDVLKGESVEVSVEVVDKRLGGCVVE